MRLVAPRARCAPTEAASERGGAPRSPPPTSPVTARSTQDNTPKEGPRLLPAEVYLQAYLDIFGGLSPLGAETLARGKDGALFDTWRDYLASLGMPDYEKDIARVGQTNAMMLASFERVGVSLCDRAIERDLRGATLDKRTVFAFEPTKAAPTEAEFAARFDVLHRTFLGYPAALAETPRTKRFFDLYNATVARHTAKGAAPSTFTPTEAGWAAVCYGLVRHPELHTY